MVLMNLFAAMETQTLRTDSDTAWGRKERAGRVERVMWKLKSPQVK